MGETEFPRRIPETEELQRRSWHAVRRNSMTASIYSSYSVGDTLHKSPADIDPFAVLGKTSSNSLPSTLVVTDPDPEFDEIHGYDLIPYSLDDYEPQSQLSRSRSNSESAALEYAQIREVMSGTSLSTQDVEKVDHENVLPTTISSTPSNKIQQYESLSSVMKRHTRDAVLRSESIDEWTEGHRVMR